MALITAAEARTRIPELTGTALDSVLDHLIAAIGRAFARYCGYPQTTAGTYTMESASYVSYLDGRGERDLYLVARPATAVASVYDDPAGDWTSSSYLVPSGDYGSILEGRRLHLTSTSTWGVWGAGAGRIKVAYTAGFATVPDDLKLACEIAVRSHYDGVKTQGKKVVSVNNQTLTYRDEELIPPAARQILDVGYVLPAAFA